MICVESDENTNREERSVMAAETKKIKLVEVDRDAWEVETNEKYGDSYVTTGVVETSHGEREVAIKVSSEYARDHLEEDQEYTVKTWTYNDVRTCAFSGKDNPSLRKPGSGSFGGSKVDPVVFDARSALEAASRANAGKSAKDILKAADTFLEWLQSKSGSSSGSGSSAKPAKVSSKPAESTDDETNVPF